MWFWIGLLFGIVAGLFTPTVVHDVHQGWASLIAGSVYTVPGVPRPVPFSLVSFGFTFVLVAGLLRWGK